MGMNSGMDKTGIFGGTFDPIHSGHLLVAQEAAATLGLEEIWFVPTGEPWLKEGTNVSPAKARLEMLELAIGKDSRFKTCSIEIDRPGPSYTVETLQELKQEGYQGKPSFIVGMDSLETLLRWQQPARLYDLCNLVGITRPAYLGINPESIEKIKPGASKDITFLNGLRIGISGTEIRKRVFDHKPITYWVPDEVERYIYENNLYGE